jgi:uncharacterized membrane protein
MIKAISKALDVPEKVVVVVYVLAVVAVVLYLLTASGLLDGAPDFMRLR